MVTNFLTPSDPGCPTVPFLVSNPQGREGASILKRKERKERKENKERNERKERKEKERERKKRIEVYLEVERRCTRKPNRREFYYKSYPSNLPFRVPLWALPNQSKLIYTTMEVSGRLP